MKGLEQLRGGMVRASSTEHPNPDDVSKRTQKERKKASKDN